MCPSNLPECAALCSPTKDPGRSPICNCQCFNFGNMVFATLVLLAETLVLAIATLRHAEPARRSQGPKGFDSHHQLGHFRPAGRSAFLRQQPMSWTSSLGLPCFGREKRTPSAHARWGLGGPPRHVRLTARDRKALADHVAGHAHTMACSRPLLRHGPCNRRRRCLVLSFFVDHGTDVNGAHCFTTLTSDSIHFDHRPARR